MSLYGLIVTNRWRFVLFSSNFFQVQELEEEILPPSAYVMAEVIVAENLNLDSFTAGTTLSPNRLTVL